MTLVQDRLPSDAAEPPNRHWRFPTFTVVVSVIILVGISMLLYPSTAAWLAQYRQSQHLGEYAEALEQIGPGGQEEEIALAEAYNRTLTGGAGASVPANDHVPRADVNVDDASYEGLLRADVTGLMARVRVPAINVDLPIYHGTTDDVLLKGVGHLQGTALPVGGDATHSVLTAHRGLASAELFNNLDQVNVGDTFTIEVFGDVLTYEVVSTQVIAPEDTETLLPQLGRDLVTLVTCTPLGINSHRILVTGERILPTPVEAVEVAGEYPDIPGFPWWAVGFGGTLLVLTTAVVISGRRRALITEAPSH